MLMHTSRTFELFADYFQFILMDDTSSDDLSTFWTDDAAHRALAMGETAVAFGTLRNVTVPVSIHVSGDAPALDPDAYDHVVTGSLTLPSGVLVVMGCTDHLPDAERMELAPGTYQFAYLMSGLETITDESEPAEDRYEVRLWPGEKRDARLVRHWRRER